jgi:flagellar biosynthesis/type III secretory pathway protein FliH
VAAAEAEAARLVAAAGPTAIALAVKMAEKIVGRAVTLAPEIMAEIAAGALASCRPGAGTVRLRIHPDDLPAVEARRAALEAGAPAAALELVADEAVGRHGCVIETSQGRVDARLETQLAALERALTAGGVRG